MTAGRTRKKGSRAPRYVVEAIPSGWFHVVDTQKRRVVLNTRNESTAHFRAYWYNHNDRTRHNGR